MTYKIRIFLMIIAVFSINTFAQTTTISSVYVNNQTTVTNCNLIDIGTTTSNNLTFYFTLSKPTAQANMAGTVKIYLVNSTSGSYTIGGEYLVQPTQWLDNGNGTTTLGGTVSCNFSSSAIQVTGSSIKIGFVIGTNAPIYSCNYPLKKTQLPEFNLSPTNVSIPCGTAPATTFTVENVYSTPGTLTYSWNAYGWIRNGSVVNSPFTTTTNTITLTPASATSLPSTVSVQTNLNSVSQGTKSCNVERTPFTTTATISGIDKFCAPTTSSVYSIANVGAGNTVTWSSSNTAVATISNATATTVTLNKVGFGNVRVIATITNSCGQTTSVSFAVQILNPVPINPANFNYGATISNQYCDSKWHYVEIGFPYQAGVSLNFISLTQNYGRLPGNSPNSIIFKFLRGFSGQFFYDINYSNGCVGLEYASEDWPSIMIKTCPQIGQRTANFNLNSEFKVFPNPSKDIVSIELINQDSSSKENAIIYAQLYDRMGQLKQKIEIINNAATFNVQDFAKGIYFLKIENNGVFETHQVSVE